MGKKFVHKEGRGLKMFFLYAALVLLLVFISLSIKAFFLLQKSKFDGHNHFTVAVVKEGDVKELIAFNPSVPSFALVKIQTDNVALSSLGRTLAFAPDVVIQAKNTLPVGDDVSQTLLATLWQFPSVHTEMTMVDVGRLFLFSKNVQEENKVIKTITLPRKESDIDKIITSFFGDETVTSENIPIQIINASNAPGMGKRLERVLNNLGCNIISVSTSSLLAVKSKIEYKGEKTYTVLKLEKLLHLPSAQMTTESGAAIVITIGEDSKKTAAF